MKYLLVLICVVGLLPLSAQNPSLEPTDQKLTLAERYQLVKSKSETFNEYKVIKEYVLDGVWKIAQDTVKAYKVKVQEARGSIAALEAELQKARLDLQQKEASVEEMVYASTHIAVLGINFDKKVFIGLVFIVTLGLLLMLGVISGRLKSMYSSVKEKIDLVNTTMFELEEYKRKSLERQTKLSRELQNERNKLMELKRG